MTVLPESVSVSIDGVSLSMAGNTVLDDVSITVEEGSIVALLGPSGCGKTTLLRTVAGLERPDRGTITLGDTVVGGDGVHVPPEKRRVGLVFQDWALFPHMSVGRNVGYGIRAGVDVAGRVAEMLGLVGMAGFEERQPSSLSGGQQQRVALARALASAPSVMLLDEPFSNLDTAMRTSVRSEVHRLLRESGVTAIFVTHDQEEAFVLGDRVAIMGQGRILQTGRPDEIYDTPATAWIASFVGDANFLPGTASGHAVDTVLGTFPLRRAAEGAVNVLVRPEGLRLVSGSGARVELVEYYGHDTMYQVRLDANSADLLWIRSPAGPRFDRGDDVSVTFVGDGVLAYDAVSSANPEANTSS